jgi:hypothetical protein
VCRMPLVVALAWGLMGMQQDFLVGRVPQGRVLAWVVAVAAVLLVLMGLAAAPAQAQATGVEVDLVVDTQPGDCGTGDCLPGERPITFNANLTVDEQASQVNGQPLTAQQVAGINRALETAVLEITVTNPNGTTQTVGEGEALCLEPGQYTVTATVTNETAVAQAVADALADQNVTAANVDIGELTEDTLVVAQCPAGDGGGGNGGDGGGGSVTAAEAQYKDKIINIPDQKTLVDTGGMPIGYGLIGVVLFGVGVPLFWLVIRRTS